MSIVSFPDRPSNLPVPLTPLVGREDEIASLCALLDRPEVRFVTLIGPGGIGKTRLALHVAAEIVHRFADGVAFVPFAPLRDPALVPATIAERLGLQHTGDGSPADSLRTYLAPRQMLLVLDNFEHLADAAVEIPALLAAAPQITVLVTSRFGLKLVLVGEHEFPVPPLALPETLRLPPLHELARVGSVALFIQRASAVRPDFALTEANAVAVAEVCRKIDGLPLAIELAAARSRILSPQALLARLSNRLQLLTSAERGVPERHTTLWNAIAWSYDLLSPSHRSLFRRLAVFAGGFTEDAAAAVCVESNVLDALTVLVEESLLRLSEQADGEPRFDMLETVREFAAEQLAADDDEEEIKRRHLAYFSAMTERAASELRGMNQAIWLDRLEREHDNLRAALNWSLANDPASAVRLAGSLGEFWSVRGNLKEGRGWLERSLAAADESAPAADRVRALMWMAWNVAVQGDFCTAATALETARSLAQASGARVAEADVLIIRGNIEINRGEPAQAETSCGAAVALLRDLDNRASLMDALNTLGIAHRDQGHLAAATAHYQEALALARELGDRWNVARVLKNLGEVARDQGDELLAAPRYAESIALSLDVGDPPGVADCLTWLGGIAASFGKAATAARLFGAAAAIYETIGVSGVDPPARPIHERDLATARAAIDETAFAAAFVAGRSLTPEDAVAEALTAVSDLGTSAKSEPNGVATGLDGPPIPSLLSPREFEVLPLLVAGKTDREIGEALFVSRRTAAAHVASILAKLGVASRTAAAAEAVRRGLV